MILRKGEKIITSNGKILTNEGPINELYAEYIEANKVQINLNKNAIEKIISGETPIGSIVSISVDGVEIPTDINGNIDLKLNSYLGATKIEYSTEKNEIILKDRNGKEISKTSLPLESILKTSEYNSITKEIELTFTNDIVIKIPMGDLISDVVTDQFLQKTGGTMSGDLNMDDHNIKNVSSLGVDGTITTATKLLVHDENDDIITNSGWNYNASYYYASGIKFTTAQEQSIYNLYFPKKTGTLLVKNTDSNIVYGVNGIVSATQLHGVLFDAFDDETIIYNPSSEIGLASTTMYEDDVVHYLKFPDTSSTTGDGSWNTYTWNLPKKSGTVVLTDDLEPFVKRSTLDDTIEGDIKYDNHNGDTLKIWEKRSTEDDETYGCFIDMTKDCGDTARYGARGIELKDCDYYETELSAGRLSIGNQVITAELDVEESRFDFVFQGVGMAHMSYNGFIVSNDTGQVEITSNCIKIGNTELTEEKLQQLLALLNN